MKRFKMILFVMGFVLFLSGCGEEVKTVEWYEKNEPVRKTQIEKCENNPGTLSNTPNCINAKAAQKKINKEAVKKAWGEGTIDF